MPGVMLGGLRSRCDRISVILLRSTDLAFALALWMVRSIVRHMRHGEPPVALVARRPWWRRLRWWLWPPRPLAPCWWRTDELRREAEHERAMAEWRAGDRRRPAPTRIPSSGVAVLQ